MKNIIYTLVCCFLVSQTYAQHSTCDDNRYANQIATETNMTTVKFGENTTFGGNDQELFMDIYQPVGDAETERPVIVWAFGGSFITGDRGDMAFLCEEYAKRGFVTVSIDYRLYDGPFFPLPDSTDMLDVVVKAVGDFKASIRSLRKSAENGNPYGIDPDLIYTGGISAGAIAALHQSYINAETFNSFPDFIKTAVNANGGVNGNTDDPANSNMGYSSESAGIVSYSGAVYKTNWMTGDFPSTLSVHNNVDNTVPYGKGSAKVFGFSIISMEGSAEIHPKLDEVQVYNQFLTIPEEGHVSYFGNSQYRTQVEELSQQFLFDLTCDPSVGIDGIDVSQQVKIFPNPSANDVQITLSDINSAYEVLVYDNLGREVLRIEDQNGVQTTIKRGTLGNGIYHVFINFEDTSLMPVVQKVVFK